MTRLRAGKPKWLAAAVVLLAACLELSGPPSSLSGISVPILPWPAVVVDDSLRDSTGVAAPLRIDAYDGAGQLVTDAQVSFIPLDTGLRIERSGYVVGEQVRTSPARIVAQVRRRADVLQTPEIRIDVVPRPDTVTPAGADTLAMKVYTLTDAADTAQVTSEVLAVTLRNRARLVSGATPATVRSWIVRYAITVSPPGVPGATTAFFAGTGTPQVAVDTTDASGLASRQVVLRTIVLPAATRVGLHRVTVEATVKERGQDVAGSPVKFVVPFQINAAP